MQFDFFLKDIVLKKIKSSDLILRLNLNYTEFHNLDQVTFSRWKNGVTTPSLMKQTLIALDTNCLLEFFQCCDVPKVPNNLELKYEQYLKQFDNYYHRLQTDILNTDCYFFKGNIDKSARIHKGYHDRLSTGREFNSLRKKYPSFDVELFYRSQEALGESSSFILYSLKPNVILRVLDLILFRESFDDVEYDNSVFVSLSYFCCKNDFEVMSGLFLNRVLLSKKQPDKLIFSVRGSECMCFFESLGAKKLCLVESSKYIGNIYLYSIEWTVLIGSSIVQKLIRNSIRLFLSNGMIDLDDEIENIKLSLC
ncbi:hypothetical protein ACNPJX_000045 [Vibrio parahaemolyticus]|nr:hypothetical protein [Vibrio parahaemolyticus]EME0129375.1 hypothetical protein [Vibrio parahaemolyticus]